ncbi:Crp/Fnr family transcriptional regulator [Pseudoflavitalea sp. G-6-1-2]|uniref:Crp/Fnr family transcriptional regulator n=1 Tax=Pseudoflavitalea sp. G-6-1-2 TaxID=2728841 RepID=UPI00146CD96A|nr:Crp/Fnr family transcriptional regulator [Pseudoflavitalea sp. G-6-1-2]NML20866.1 Crp/Fnr family transcriptional regulator [Pseudoflavitalea sp. G-6-1-2]
MEPSYEPLLKQFRKYIVVDNALRDAIQSRCDVRLFRKGEIIHHSDRVCVRSYFIITGLVRTYYVKDGVEISEYFSAEKEWVNSPKSFIQQTLDIYDIDALEDTEAYSIEVHDLVYLFDHFPLMERYARLSMGHVFGHLMERITVQRFSTAREKYEHFLKVYHDIYHRIPLGMIASYLGITQSTLSRLRAEK